MDVFFFGAGFSKYLNEEMPLMNDLGRNIIKQGWQKEIYNSDFKRTNNIESFMSFLSEEYPWERESEHLRKRAVFLEVSGYIAEMISSHSASPLQLSEENIVFFQRLIDRQSSIVTLNYDLLLERGLDDVSQKKNRARLEYRYLYQIPLSSVASREGNFSFTTYSQSVQPKVFKLHGSINWFYSGKSSYYGETIFLNVPNEIAIASKPRAAFMADKVQLIIPPTFSKSSYFNNETIRLLWRLAFAEISKAKRIIFFGYSFPMSDSVIKTMLQNFIHDGVDVVVVNPDTHAFDGAKSWLGSEKVMHYADPQEFISKYNSEDI